MRDHNSYSFPLYHEKKLNQNTALKLLHFAFKSGIVIVLMPLDLAFWRVVLDNTLWFVDLKFPHYAVIL